MLNFPSRAWRGALAGLQVRIPRPHAAVQCRGVLYSDKDYQALIYTSGLEQLIVNADATRKGAEAEVDWVPGNCRQ